MNQDYINWSPADMVEVTLQEADDFLKVKETLSRIGVPSKKSKTLYQTAHILHKQGKYYIVHFLELFALDGKEPRLTEYDIMKRNTIAELLEDWNLVAVVDKAKTKPKTDLRDIKIVGFKEKAEWTLSPKYNIGSKKRVY
jgi:hypothetical protein